MTTSPIRIATRRSKLALWQAEHVAALLRNAHPGLPVELVPMTTQGDRVLDRALAEVGGKGLFVKELEVAMQERRADIAVHSMKDVPSELPRGVLHRGGAASAPIRSMRSSRAVTPGLPTCRRARASARQARGARRSCAMHGRTCGSSCCAATSIHACAGSTRASSMRSCSRAQGWSVSASQQHVTEQLDLELSLPAVGQGVIGIECRTEDAHSRAALQSLHHADSYTRLLAERAFAATLGGSCHSPIAAHATLDGDTLVLRGFIGAPDGSQTFRDRMSGPAADAVALGRSLARRMLAAGAAPLLERLRQEAAAAS